MTKEELSELTDQELLVKARKLKSDSIISALLIGFAIGIVIYSIVANTLGLFTLIPLYLAYRLINSDKRNQALKKVLKERNLK